MTAKLEKYCPKCEQMRFVEFVLMMPKEKFIAFCESVVLRLGRLNWRL